MELAPDPEDPDDVGLIPLVLGGTPPGAAASEEAEEEEFLEEGFGGEMGDDVGRFDGGGGAENGKRKIN